MIVGVLGAIAGLSTSVAGVISGLIFVVFGWKIYSISSKQYSQNIQQGKSEKSDRVVGGLLSIFLSGFLIVSIILGVMFAIGIYALFQYKP